MTKKKPKGHNIGGTSKQKRRKENKDQLYWRNMNKQNGHSITLYCKQSIIYNHEFFYIS